MKKFVNGQFVAMTAEEIEAFRKQAEKAKIEENSRPMTTDELSRLFIARNINTVITDDATASRAVELHPVMKYDGALISAKTRINWGGALKRAAVDLWDTEANNPDNAPDLWEDISYKNGYRIIPGTITATLAFAEGECGWWDDVLYRSEVGGNVYTPEVYPDNWELIMKLTTEEGDV